MPKRKTERKTRHTGKGLKEIAAKVWDWIVPSTLSRNFKNTLEKYKDAEINEIIIGRDPVQSMIQKVVNWISGGDYERKKKELKYDDVFHLYALLKLNNGKTLILEKNAIPKLAETSKSPTDSISIVVKSGLKVGDFIKNTIKRMGEKDYVRYDAASRNCQDFIENHLKANGLSTPERTKFIMQEADKLIGGTTRNVAKGITDVAAIGKQLLGGKKRKPRKTKTQTGGSSKKNIYLIL